MDRHAANEGVIPSDMTPEIYIEIQSLQLAILLMSVCHVIVVVMDTMEADTTIRFLCTAASLKPSCVPTTAETTSDTESLDEPAEYYPHIGGLPHPTDVGVDLLCSPSFPSVCAQSRHSR